MKKIILYSAFIISSNVFAQPSEFNAPWKDTSKAIILDPYANNYMDWSKIATDNRVAGIIHKATEGNKTDKKYKERKAIALQKGYLWGAYHLGRPGDPITQADYFLNVIEGDSNILMALDLEEMNPSFMSLKNAEKFIQHIFEKTGKYPLVYCNMAVLKEIEKNYSNESAFAKCGLWYARFRSNIPDFSKKLWISYTIWQFSSEINCSTTGKCLYNVPGTDKNMDVNIFNGTAIELKSNWANLSKHFTQ